MAKSAFFNETKITSTHYTMDICYSWVVTLLPIYFNELNFFVLITEPLILFDPLCALFLCTPFFVQRANVHLSSFAPKNARDVTNAWFELFFEV